MEVQKDSPSCDSALITSSVSNVNRLPSPFYTRNDGGEQAAGCPEGRIEGSFEEARKFEMR